MQTQQLNQTQADYELHLPRWMGHPIIALTLVVLVNVTILFLFDFEQTVAWSLCSSTIVIGMGYVGLSAFLRKTTDLEQRLKDREVILDEISWRGDETVLDVGCGNGILLLEAAKRFPDGQGIGIDIWTEGSGENSAEKFLKNAELEGVAERITLKNEDARSLPYDANYFDVVLSGLTMHHILHDKLADKAVNEMARVLKPDGWLAIYDVPIAVKSTAKLMKKAGLTVTKQDKKMVFGRKSVNK